MNARTAIFSLALVAAAPAYAGVIGDIAAQTGLSQRKVEMILGNRTCFAEYTRSYDRSLAQFRRTLGAERADRLLSGQPVMLDRDYAQRVVLVPARREVAKR